MHVEQIWHFDSSIKCVQVLLKVQCVGVKGDLFAEMEYCIHNYVFISVQSPVTIVVFSLA